MMIDKEKIYGTFLTNDPEWVVIIVGPLDLEILVKLDLSEFKYNREIKTRNELWGVCKAINENRLDIFDSQECLRLVLEKFASESLIYDNHWTT